MWLFYFKALHIIGFVAWFAGLFYLVRIFVYHREAFDKPPQERDVLIAQFKIMEWRVYRIICNPAMMITMTFGIAMLLYNPAYLSGTWMHIKLSLVLLLLAYHLYCKSIIRTLGTGQFSLSAFQFRLLNEFPTLLLFFIVFLAVFKDAINPLQLLIGIILFALLLFAVAKAYKKRRTRKQ